MSDLTSINESLLLKLKMTDFKPLYFNYIDDQYPFKRIIKKRRAARAFAFDKDGHLLLHLIKRDDIFNKHEYLETPGGGLKENETPFIALKREIKEELGREIIKSIYLGRVDDCYNLLEMANEVYFYAVILSDVRFPIQKISRGDSLIAETKVLTLNEAISYYEGSNEGGISFLVKRKELPFLYALRDYEILSSLEKIVPS